MKITIDSIKKTILLAGGLFLSVLSVNADDIQNKLNLDYFRSPEATAFMKYGEESVNEYTGTADISVPLYTIKCKDIEIPIVLKYDASGIKVEQEESWVGLGWDLTIGGCINYVCAGTKDKEFGPYLDDSSWTQFLSTVMAPYYGPDLYNYSGRNCDFNVLDDYVVSPTPYGLEVNNKQNIFEVKKDAVCDLLIKCDSPDALFSKKPYVKICQWDDKKKTFYEYKKIAVTQKSSVQKEITLPAGKYYIDYGFDNYIKSDYGFSIKCDLSGWNLSDVYLGTKKTQFYEYKKNDANNWNWMSRVPYEYSFAKPSFEYINGEIKNSYLFRGYGERDFYSVNVLGKTFMFFLDPFTLNTYPIGQAGEEFKVETCRGTESYVLQKKNYGREEQIYDWKITDSNGYIYYFTQGDKLFEPQAGGEYTSCWYLTKINSPLGEKVEFSYIKQEKMSRPRNIESLCIPILKTTPVVNNVRKITENDFGKGSHSFPQSTRVYYHYLTAIKTANQTVTFETSRDDDCSGEKWDVIRLDAIKIASTNTNSVMKTIKFSYSHFEHEKNKGIKDPEYNDKKYYSDNRIKLENVKEIASGDTLTTSFSYNEEVKLPSKRSCAQDYWGYYNGQDNKVNDQYTLIPTPQSFMNINYSPAINEYKGADRFSRDGYMQAAMLKKVVYPTGGYTTYEYEPNSILTNDFTLSNIYREKHYDISYEVSQSCSETPYGPNYIGVTRTEFSLSKEAIVDLVYQSKGGESELYGRYMQIEICRWNDSKHVYDVVEKKSLPFSYSPQSSSILQDLKLSPGKYYLGLTPMNNKKEKKNGNDRDYLCYNAVNFYLCGWNKSTLSKSNYTLICGGLRIKNISNYDNDNSLIDSISYSYSDKKGSTGVLLNNIETIDVQNGKCYKGENDPIPTSTNIYTYKATANIYTITPGRARCPEFYASCNPAIVGYSQVTKRKYNKKGNIEKYIITNFINNAPSNDKVKVIDYFQDFSNGKILGQDILDADSNLVLRTNNTYDIKLANHYAINMGYRDETVVNIGNPHGADQLSGESQPKTEYWRYPYILSRAELAKTTTTEYCKNGKTIVKTKEYSYNPRNHQVSQIDENTSLPNQIQRTKIKYSVDGFDNVNVDMRNMHRLNDVVENKVVLVEDGIEKSLSTKHTTYAKLEIKDSKYFLPSVDSTSIGNNPLEARAKYSYDDMLNVRSISLDGKETVYLWSYKGQYPVAKIEGLTYAEVENAVTKSVISDLLRSATPKPATINSIRSKIKAKGGLITTYTYKPLVGITSETKPNGLKTTYEYDGFGRLTQVLDHNNKVVSTNSYNYKK